VEPPLVFHSNRIASHEIVQPAPSPSGREVGPARKIVGIGGGSLAKTVRLTSAVGLLTSLCLHHPQRAQALLQSPDISPPARRGAVRTVVLACLGRLDGSYGVEASSRRR
jgi:hypothetical protein